VAYTCNPSYSGGKDQEDHDLKPAWANSLWNPVLKIPNLKEGWWSGSGGIEALSSSSNITKKKKSSSLLVQFSWVP
jgi:hypothetical protein